MSRKTDKNKYQKKLQQQLIHQHNHFHFLQNVIQYLLDKEESKPYVEEALDACKVNLGLWKERVDEVDRLKKIFEE